MELKFIIAAIIGGVLGLLYHKKVGSPREVVLLHQILMVQLFMER